MISNPRSPTCGTKNRCCSYLKKEKAAKEEEYEDLFREVNDRRAGLEKEERDLTSVKERLKLKNADEVERRMADVIRRLGEIGQHLPVLMEEKGRMESDINSHKEEIKTLATQVEFFEHLKTAWEETFRTEYKRYLPEEEQEQDLKAAAAELLKNFKPDIERKKRLSSDFESRFRDVQGLLLDYRLEINDRKIVREGEWTFNDWPGDLVPRLEQWQDLTHQKLFECDYQGTRGDAAVCDRQAE
ncbi:hypothetical protein QS257_17675 [Terrilactibacillus sp. S3-3]|nr:hypothetical protein QS257_17675 [Terrilactibacillus sp. S3-3]